MTLLTEVVDCAVPEPAPVEDHAANAMPVPATAMAPVPRTAATLWVLVNCMMWLPFQEIRDWKERRFRHCSPLGLGDQLAPGGSSLAPSRQPRGCPADGDDSACSTQTAT